MRLLATIGIVALVGCTTAPTGTGAPEPERLDREAMAARVRRALSAVSHP